MKLDEAAELGADACERYVRHLEGIGAEPVLDYLGAAAALRQIKSALIEEDQELATWINWHSGLVKDLEAARREVSELRAELVMKTRLA